MKKYNCIIRWFFFGVFFSSLLCTNLYGKNLKLDGSSYDSFNIMVDVDKVGRHSLPALYVDQSKNVFFPIEELFQYLKINNEISENGRTITGYIENGKNKFVIDYIQESITYRNIVTPISNTDVILSMGSIYISKNALEHFFGFKIVFDFRSLSAQISASFEFPIVKQIKQENARDNLLKIKNEVMYDSIMPRKYHLFKSGMVDWAIASNQSKDYSNETRAGLGLGAEVLHGEADVWLNYSNIYTFNRSQQRYNWRWVDNNTTAVRQVQFGRIYNRSIASLLYPVDGFTITNAPSTVRKALGDYQISDYTQPNWIVELYINNSLVNVTNADAAGFFTFKVPIVYGISNVTLRFYGPNGEERSDEKVISMPYNMLPKGEFEYRIAGGYVLDSVNSRYDRSEVNFGLNRWLTIGGGTEYLSSIRTNKPYIPFATFTFQPLQKLIITGEYAHEVRFKGTLNYTFPRNAILELQYLNYNKNQTAIIYNYLEERVGGLSIPYRINKVSGLLKSAFRENIYSNFSYNAAEFLATGHYFNFDVNVNNLCSWTSFGGLNIYTNMALGVRVNRGLNVRLNGQYNYSTKSIISLKGELEKQISKNGLLTVGCENNVLANYNSIIASFKYDLSFVSAFVSSYFSKRRFVSSESLRGSFAFGSGTNFVYADKQNAVGRAGISIIPYIDINFNGKRDAGEPGAERLDVRCNGGQIVSRGKDSIVRVVGLESFVDYALILDESNFDNLAWRIQRKSIKVTTDPNQFKQIYVAVQPMGEVTGMIVGEKNNGIGRVLINIKKENGAFVTKIQSESDGYFSYLGLPPGNYTVEADSVQLTLLQMESKIIPVTIDPNKQGDSKDVGSIVLAPLDSDFDGIPNSLDKCPDTPETERKSVDANGCTIDTDGDGVPDILDKCESTPIDARGKIDAKGCPKDTDGDGILDYVDTCPTIAGVGANKGCPEIKKAIKALFKKAMQGIQFEIGKSNIKPLSFNLLNQIAKGLIDNPTYIIEVDGHTDNVGNSLSNLTLSDKRAAAVKDYLIKKGVDAKRMSSHGYGDTKPIAINKTKAGKTLNRRVEFVVTFEEISFE